MQSTKSIETYPSPFSKPAAKYESDANRCVDVCTRKRISFSAPNEHGGFDDMLLDGCLAPGHPAQPCGFGASKPPFFAPSVKLKPLPLWPRRNRFVTGKRRKFLEVLCEQPGQLAGRFGVGFRIVPRFFGN